MYEWKLKSVSAISTEWIISRSSTAYTSSAPWKIHGRHREFKGWMCGALQSINPGEVIWFWADSLTDWRRAAVTDVSVFSICSSDKHKHIQPASLQLFCLQTFTYFTFYTVQKKNKKAWCCSTFHGFSPHFLSQQSSEHLQNCFSL